jgi:hypothetical protein
MAEPLRAVFVFALDGEPFVFRTLAEAAGWMEAIDVRDGEYPALFTDTGRVVEATATPNFDVLLALTDRYDPAGFRALLRERTSGLGVKVGSDDVLAIGDALVREEWEHRWPQHPRWLARRLHGDRPRPL